MVSSLTGPTMAAGMPPEDSPSWADVLRERLPLALAMLPLGERCKANRRLADALIGLSLGQKLTPDGRKEALKILRAAKISRELRGEIDQLRRQIARSRRVPAREALAADANTKV